MGWLWCYGGYDYVFGVVGCDVLLGVGDGLGVVVVMLDWFCSSVGYVVMLLVVMLIVGLLLFVFFILFKD